MSDARGQCGSSSPGLVPSAIWPSLPRRARDPTRITTRNTVASSSWRRTRGTISRVYIRKHGTFRVHLYDNFSQPLSAKPFKGRVVLKETFDPATRETRELLAYPLLPRATGAIWRRESRAATMPDRARGQDPVREGRSVRALRLRVLGIVERRAECSDGCRGAGGAARPRSDSGRNRRASETRRGPPRARRLH